MLKVFNTILWMAVYTSDSGQQQQYPAQKDFQVKISHKPKVISFL